MLEVLNEKELFLLSTVPPLLLTVLVLRALSGNPQPLLDWVKPLVPGLSEVKNYGNGCMCFRLEAKADVVEQSMKVVQDHVQLTGSLLRRARSSLSSTISGGIADVGAPDVPRMSAEQASNSDVEMGDSQQGLPDAVNPGAPRQQHPLVRTLSKQSGTVKEQEIWINSNHLVRASSVPVLFLMLFFWDEAIMHRRASYDFPLLHCMDPDSSHCFYMAQEYSVFKWPHYEPLDCHAMRDETIEDVTEYKFYFAPPPSAHFYKCYSTVFTFNALVGALGDIMALTALCALVIIRASVQVNTLDGTTLDDLLAERRVTRLNLIGATLLFVLSLFTVSKLYGKWTNDLVFYLFFPGLCIFSSFLINNRLELLEERIRNFEDEDGETSVSSAEESRGDACLGWVCGRITGLDKPSSHVRNLHREDTEDFSPPTAIGSGRGGSPSTGRRDEAPSASHAYHALVPAEGADAEEAVPLQVQQPIPSLRAPYLPLPQINAQFMVDAATRGEIGSTGAQSRGSGSSISPGSSRMSKFYRSP